MRYVRSLGGGFALLGALLLCAPAGRAQVSTVTIDTGALNGLGTFYLNFQLVDGSFTGDGNSQVTVTGFGLSGGQLGAGPPALTGDVTGSVADTMILRDGDPATVGFADYLQGFTVTSPVSQMRFDLTPAATSPDVPFPDSFTFSVLDASLVPLPTDGPAGVELVDAVFTSASPIPTGASTLGPPELTAVVTPAGGGAVPEPGTLALLVAAGALVPVGARARRQRRRADRRRGWRP